MRIARFRHDGRQSYGILEGKTVQPVSAGLFGGLKPEGSAILVADVKLLAPVDPRKILAAAVNYHSHVPSGKSVLKDDGPPQVPQLFLKPSSSVVGPDDTIVLPAGARRVDAEGELVAVIGRMCRNVSLEDALPYVFGYTCGNDVSARHWQRDDVQWWRAKGSDTFSPIGPVIATGLDPRDLQLRTRVNGEQRQSSSTALLIYSLAELISFASTVMTLEAGDLVFTGTPGETPKLDDGDVVEIEIEGIGVLRNSVRREAED